MSAGAAQVMVLSHTKSGGSAPERTQEGKAVAYARIPSFLAILKTITSLFTSGELCFEDGKVLRSDTARPPTSEVVFNWLVQDLPSVERVYVFVEDDECTNAIGLILKLSQLKKVVYIIARKDSGWVHKVDMAQALRVPLIEFEHADSEVSLKLFEELLLEPVER
jgi:hypothetical protein